jgi:diguanylate cyclase (GGDEF)-like protein
MSPEINRPMAVPERLRTVVEPTLRILYVGTRHRSAVEDIVSRGGVIDDVRSIYEGIARLKRTSAGGIVVEREELLPDPEGATAALRAAAGDRPLLISMTPEEWEELRASGLLEPEEVLLRPCYPDELWRRLHRAAAPPSAKAILSFRHDADRLIALVNDARRLNRFTNDLGAFAEHCVTIVKARLRAGRVSLFLRGEGEGEMQIASATGLARDVMEEAVVRLGEGVAGEFAAGRRIVHVKEAGKDGPATSERAYRHPSYLIAPLLHEHEVLGILCVSERLEEGDFTEQDVAYMEAFADTAAQIAHNGLLYRAADELALIDEGTQLYNRRHFNRVGPQEVNRAKRYRHDLTLALMDLDHFKAYNDANGHQEGDRALAVVAHALKESFREADIVVRYGGEEFAVIMPETSRKEGNGVDFVDRARQRVEEAGLTFEDENGTLRRLTISGGVATLPLQAETWEGLFEKADQALYRAKARGRNLIVGY